MKTLYLDNAATSFPKPERVASAMEYYTKSVGANLGRSAYSQALDAARTTLRLRQRASALFNFGHPDHVVITPGCTAGINMALQGLLNPGDHVLVTPMEHNAAMRTLRMLEKKGVDLGVLPCNASGLADPLQIKALARPNTKLVFCCHGSNVSGVVQDLEAMGRICRELGIFLAADAAQTAGHLPIDFREMNLSALAVPGHKGLLGPQGIGLLLLDPNLARQLDPLILGGTGSRSDLEEMPDFMPDRLEAGTLNIPGIYGLEAALAYLEEHGIEETGSKIRRLTEIFMESLKDITELRIICGDPSCGIVSLDFLSMDNAEAAALLADDYGILTRCGLHCAPAAHKALKTFPQGTVRFSFCSLNEEEDARTAAEAVRKLLKKSGQAGPKL